jgi:hypothetical protein
MTASAWRWPAVLIQVGAWVATGLLAWPDHLQVLATPWLPMYVSFGVAGLLVVLRRFQHTVGWLMLGLGMLSSIGVGCIVLASRLADSGALIAAGWVDAGANAMLTVGMLAVPAILVVFPDGRPTRFGRPLLWLAALSATVGAGAALVNGGWGGDPSQALVESPLREQTQPLGDFVAQGFYLLLALSMVGASASLVIRWRNSAGLQRQQIKWLAMGAALAVTALAVTGFNTSELWEVALAASAFATVPVAIVAAILRYRLYEIDRIISRTVSYTIVVAALGALFALIAVVLPNWLPGAGDSPLLVAASTLAVAGLFNPVRRRVQRWVERRFNRARYDAQRVMDDFVANLRGEHDAADIVNGWTGVVAETMQPAVVGVWVRP